ncbi:uncharacterized protein BJ171DRAFT_310298 [Polychytrium aggregatum]|uniref:uncharacterized protein n=1 Tax=Polychytrium aggregatum TaxID=110093 RepID=UPI0022FDB5BB|nr:uncharacterized protein BJ171DRAFT_310298 [Polychytrium aggregatum]KAI9207015.1 hypothetical protein BJ171DRAFT_310298 [Polychytrium aggregatum]
MSSSWNVLNDDNQDSERHELYLQRKAQIESFLRLYNDAIAHRLRGRSAEAKSFLETLVKESFFKEQLDPINDVQTSQPHQLQYVVFKNYARYLEEDGNLDQALSYYKKAHRLTNRDEALALKIARIMMQRRQYEGAVALLKQVYADALMEEHRQNALRAMCEVFFHVGDTAAALKYTKLALLDDDGWATGIWIFKSIIDGHLQALASLGYLNADVNPEDLRLYAVHKSRWEALLNAHPEARISRRPAVSGNHDTHVAPCELYLEDASWLGLGRLLLNHIRSDGPQLSAAADAQCIVIRIGSELRLGLPGIDVDMAMSAAMPQTPPPQQHHYDSDPVASGLSETERPSSPQKRKAADASGSAQKGRWPNAKCP